MNNIFQRKRQGSQQAASKGLCSVTRMQNVLMKLMEVSAVAAQKATSEMEGTV